MQSISYQLHAVEALVFTSYKMYKINGLQNNQNTSYAHINKSTDVTRRGRWVSSTQSIPLPQEHLINPPSSNSVQGILYSSK